MGRCEGCQHIYDDEDIGIDGLCPDCVVDDEFEEDEYFLDDFNKDSTQDGYW